MNAQEMFEKLGYKLYKQGTILDDYVLQYVNGDWVVEFSYLDKEYNADDITVQLHKAITKQMEELGWI
jgi:hypothetical protein